jgi:hypothetical protein
MFLCWVILCVLNCRPYAGHYPFLARDPFGAYFLPSQQHSVALGVLDLVKQGLQASALVGVFNLH